jgi:hypothetical protein
MGNTNFAYYIVNPGRALFLQTGPTAPPLAGAAEVQSATTAALPGNYVFLLEHSAAPSTGTFRKAGMLQLDMAGNIVGGRETGDPSGVITGGTLALAAGGRGLLSYTINTGASLIDRSAVIYILDPSTFFMMSTDTPDSFPGIGLAQQVQPGNLATGAFSYNVAELGQNNLLEVGQLIVRGTAGASSATLSGITYVNNNGTLSSVALAGTMPETSGKVRVAPLLGSQTAAMIFYVRGPNGAALVGTSPDVDGRLELQ